MSITTIPLSELVYDFDMYPRQQVSSVNVTNLVAALKAGEILPPMVVDEASKRVVDGFHRGKAYLKVLGADGKVKVDLRSYGSDRELFTAAVEANSRHGLQLEEVEKRRVTLRLQALGADDDEIAATLHIPPAKVQRILFRTATVTEGGGTIRREGLKRPHFHFSGKPMTEAQATAAKSAPGTSYALLIRQLRDAIRWHLIDEDDANTLDGLRVLAAEIVTYLDGLQEEPAETG